MKRKDSPEDMPDGPWQPTQLNPRSTKYSWKLFNFNWTDATEEDHRIVSRVTDINGKVQAAPEELPEKVSFWEDFGQFTRTVRI